MPIAARRNVVYGLTANLPIKERFFIGLICAFVDSRFHGNNVAVVYFLKADNVRSRPHI
jgi:hypothetical protein